MSASGMFASSDEGMSVEPTGVEPTGVDPTGVEPTGVDPTGAEPSWPPTSICSTLVDGVAFVQSPPLSGISPPAPHQALKPPGRSESGVEPSRSDDQWTLRKSVVAKLTSLSGSPARRAFAVGSPAMFASVSEFSGRFAKLVPARTCAHVAPSVTHCAWFVPGNGVSPQSGI